MLASGLEYMGLLLSKQFLPINNILRVVHS